MTDAVLFTVTATFSDFTNAVEQYQAHSPEAAAIRFVETSKSMSPYDRKGWDELGSGKVTMIHVADGLRGAWIWTPRVTLECKDVAMLGGMVVQTDPTAPTRPT